MRSSLERHHPFGGLICHRCGTIPHRRQFATCCPGWSSGTLGCADALWIILFSSSSNSPSRFKTCFGWCPRPYKLWTPPACRTDHLVLVELGW